MKTLLLTLTLLAMSLPVKISFAQLQSQPVDNLKFLPKGTVIRKVVGEKIYCFLPRNVRIQGVLCRGDESRGWETVFYSNGKLALAWLPEPQKIQGVPCAASSFWSELFTKTAAVYFYKNGKLKSCKLDSDLTVTGKKFEAGERINFDESGKLIFK